MKKRLIKKKNVTQSLRSSVVFNDLFIANSLLIICQRKNLVKKKLSYRCERVLQRLAWWLILHIIGLQITSEKFFNTPIENALCRYQFGVK